MIPDSFFDLPCDQSNLTTQAPHHFFEILCSKHLNLAQISSIDRLNNSFESLTHVIKCFVQGLDTYFIYVFNTFISENSKLSTRNLKFLHDDSYVGVYEPFRVSFWVVVDGFVKAHSKMLKKRLNSKKRVSLT